MLCRRIAVIKYMILVGVGMLLYAEVFVYYVQPAFWPVLECSRHDPSCTKILFIADPQIQGDYAAPAPLHQIFSWDSDRYLENTFKRALNTLKPDILVFLGDLTDEGSISTMEQYHNYVKRLFDIFTVNYSLLQIWLPGDNDIGGEHEIVKKNKVEEFEKVFSQPVVSIMELRNITFFKVSGIMHSKPDVSEYEDSENLKIVLSHYPLGRTIFGNQVKHEIEPNILFCAHNHVSKYIRYEKKIGLLHAKLTQDLKSPLHIVFSDDYIHEIFVPTCSYRMGTEEIGFGAAVFEHNNKEMRYAVFWSPSRFRFLVVYLVFITFVIFYCMMYCTVRVISNCIKLKPKKSKNQMNNDEAPLLS